MHDARDTDLGCTPLKKREINYLFSYKIETSLKTHDVICAFGNHRLIYPHIIQSKTFICPNLFICITQLYYVRYFDACNKYVTQVVFRLVSMGSTIWSAILENNNKKKKTKYSTEFRIYYLICESSRGRCTIELWTPFYVTHNIEYAFKNLKKPVIIWSVE